jgi:hypothetical protein
MRFPSGSSAWQAQLAAALGPGGFRRYRCEGPRHPAGCARRPQSRPQPRLRATSPTPRGSRTTGLEGHLPEVQPLKAAATGDLVRVLSGRWHHGMTKIDVATGSSSCYDRFRKCAWCARRESSRSHALLVFPRFAPVPNVAICRLTKSVSPSHMGRERMRVRERAPTAFAGRARYAENHLCGQPARRSHARPAP